MIGCTPLKLQSKYKTIHHTNKGYEEYQLIRSISSEGMIHRVSASTRIYKLNSGQYRVLTSDGVTELFNSEKDAYLFSKRYLMAILNAIHDKIFVGRDYPVNMVVK